MLPCSYYKNILDQKSNDNLCYRITVTSISRTGIEIPNPGNTSSGPEKSRKGKPELAIPRTCASEGIAHRARE